MNLFKKMFITDWAVIIYVIFITIWTFIGRNVVCAEGFLVIGRKVLCEAGENVVDVISTFHLLMVQYIGILLFIFLIVMLNNYIKNPFVRFIRFWYPITLLGFFFDAATQIDRVLFTEYLDPIFQYWDYLIFGYQPVVEWGLKWNSFVIQEFFHFNYFAYYLMIFGVPLYVYLHKGKAEFVRVLFNVLFVFFTCYVVFVFLPVAGGRIMENYYLSGVYYKGYTSYVASVRELTETYRHGLFTHIMVYIYRSSTHFGGAFPSSHVAVSLTIALLSFRYFKLLAWVLVLMTFFLAISTVFCHYHYFVDAVAGVLYGIVMFGLSELVYALIGVKNVKYIDD